jgi:UDP-N-acetylmuramate: L-alanyl-gamma-D-glutamyl-meso-diaminopimelate ligase
MHLHILGICGTFMAGLAALARELGHRVTGSDSQVYPPMSDFLRQAGIEIDEGWRVEALTPRPDLVVIGNALSRGNPLVEAVLDAGMPYTSGAQWVADHVLPGRQVIAVAGTHGKTTTTSLIAWLLEACGQTPGYLIGGIPANFPAPARLGKGSCFVIEADEYDTAFFDKRSKFVHYRPQIAVLNNLEYDHADIFPNLESIKRQFHHLLRTVPRSGCIVWNKDEASLADVLARGCWSRTASFGSEGADWTLSFEQGASIVAGPAGSRHKLASSLAGRHNAFNTVAALAAVTETGVALGDALDALKSFHGVKRRLEHLGTVAGVSVFDDFAHHPTAIAATVDALGERLPDARLIGVLEMRSNSMRAGAHREGLAAALRALDRCLVFVPPSVNWDVGAALAPLGKQADTFSDTASLLDTLLAEARSGDQILIMSNGGFEGLHGRLLEALGQAAGALS